MNVKMKSQNLALRALRDRGRRSTEIAISVDSYLEPTPSTRTAIVRYPAPWGIDQISPRKYYQYFL
eukprot:4019431-Pleurochrysis_carterae.AAC.1